MYHEARTQLQTIRDLLRFAVSRFNEAGLFFGHGSPRPTMKRLISFSTRSIFRSTGSNRFSMPGLPRLSLSRYWASSRRRATEKIPAAYLTNEAWLGISAFSSMSA